MMNFERIEESWGQLLKLSGEIDLHGSPLLRNELLAIAKEKPALLLVDFSHVDYIDSSGLATLIEYVKEAGAHQGKIALFGLKKKVRTIFDLVRLNELFAIAETRDEALASVEQR
ncbi:MAG: STAS domain-containing protein [Terrimicrobiaceae bacterium]